MNIFIYGNQNFKKDIQKILINSKIETILDDVKIEEISTIESLKEKIATNPDDIYLIDEDKIIKKSRFKFLRPKDGIEEEFLLQCGVSDLSIDSLEEIPNYIIRKYERKIAKEEEKTLEIKDEDLVLDNELSELLESKNQENGATSVLEEPIGLDINELDSLIELTPKQESKIISDLEDFNEDFGLNNVSFDYDDDSVFNDSTKSDEDLLSDILNASIADEDDYEFTGETFEDVNFLDEIFPNKTIFDSNEDSVKPINIVLNENDSSKEDNKEESELNEDDFESLKNFDFEDIKQNEEKTNSVIDENIDIIDELEELDTNKLFFNLDEKDEEKDEEESKIEELETEELDLEDFDFSNNTFINRDFEDVSKKGDEMSDEFLELDSLDEQDLMEALGGSTSSVQIEKQVEQQNKNSVELHSSNVDDIASLISKLLNNKTLEITIKIKE